MGTIRRELDGLNPASPTDLKRLLLDELELPVLAHTDSCDACKNGYPVESHTGKPSFKKVVMEEYDLILEHSNDNRVTAKRVLEYRGWQKAVTSLYEPLLTKVGPDGRIRTEFHQHRAVTGRLSSSNPNLQQVPRGTDKPWNGDAKKSFNAGDGYEDYALYGWDYPQVEFRIAAAYGDESLLLTEFAKPDADPFSVLATVVFGVLTPETRHYVKNGFVYPTLYGAGLRKIAATLGKTKAEVEPQYGRFKDTIPGIVGVSQQVSRLLEQRGFVKYWDGRRRHIRERSASYKGFNAVCQGGSAQLLKRAMLRIRSEIETSDCFMVLTVHDEITFLVKRDLIKEYEPKILECMTQIPPISNLVNLGIPEGKEWGVTK
jgi:DNA polymerase-1